MNFNEKNNSPFGYILDEEKQIDSYGVDHSGFSLRDELAYQIARTNQEEKLQKCFNNQGVTKSYPQFGNSFWGGNSANNYGFGTCNIEDNVAQVQSRPLVPLTEAQNEQNSNFSIKKFADSILNYFPEYKTLKDAKNEMDKVNRVGYDNYAHRLGMCRIGQMGGIGSILSPAIGLRLGLAKEGYDLFNKSIKGNVPWVESLYDSLKDIKNNKEALSWGLKNPDESCRVWLEDLDYENNKWRNKP